MDREPMNQNQKFVLLVFALVLVVGVVLVCLNINSGLSGMI